MYWKFRVKHFKDTSLRWIEENFVQQPAHFTNELEYLMTPMEMLRLGSNKVARVVTEIYYNV
jgi:hypothetical protein